jgi:V/A-type H+-transporting ATPase subunit K
MKIQFKENKLIMTLVLFFTVTMLLGASFMAFSPQVMAESENTGNGTFNNFALGAAAFTTIGGTVAAAVAVSLIGTAGLGVMAEKPELFGNIVVFVGLAEGLAIYGLIVGIMILSKI